MRDGETALDGSILSRHECKYYISERTHAAVRQFIAPFVRPDDYARRHPGNRYPVYSLYLDSLDLNLHRMSVEGQKNRFKLRVRSYAAQSDGPVYLEIKRRRDTVLSKSRTAVAVDVARDIALRGAPSRGSDGPCDPVRGEFVSLVRRTAAVPLVRVRYQREAYESASPEPVRITFDTELAYAMSVNDASVSGSGAWHSMPVEGGILEIKFTELFPAWIRALIDRFELSRRSIPKYGLSIEAALQAGLYRRQDAVSRAPVVPAFRARPGWKG